MRANQVHIVGTRLAGSRRGSGRTCAREGSSWHHGGPARCRCRDEDLAQQRRRFRHKMEFFCAGPTTSRDDWWWVGEGLRKAVGGPRRWSGGGLCGAEAITSTASGRGCRLRWVWRAEWALAATSQAARPCEWVTVNVPTLPVTPAPRKKALHNLPASSALRL